MEVEVGGRSGERVGGKYPVRKVASSFFCYEFEDAAVGYCVC